MILIHFFMYLFLHCNVASSSLFSIAILIVCPFSFANSFALHIFYAQMCAQIHPHKYNKNLCLHLRPQLFLSILQPFHILLSPHNFIHLQLEFYLLFFFCSQTFNVFFYRVLPSVSANIAFHKFIYLEFVQLKFFCHIPKFLL